MSLPVTFTVMSRLTRGSGLAAMTHRVVFISLFRRLASGDNCRTRSERVTYLMLVLTDAAAEVVKSVTEPPQAPEGTGLRISQSAPEPNGGRSLELAAAGQPGADDQIVESSGARVFLDPPAAAYLDDKVLDAEVDAQGKVHFTLGSQEQRRE